MFGAAIIVFRETLEAALLIGIIAAATHTLPGRNRWLAIGITAGLGGALLVANLAGHIADLADGAGQDIFNASVLGIAVAMLAWHNIWMARHGKEMAAQARALSQDVHAGQQELSAIALVIAMAVLREGSETALFLLGMASGGDLQAGGALTGGILGLVAGIVLGFGLYAGLVRIPVRWFFSVTSALVLLLAAGMASQLARALLQGDFVAVGGESIWDTSSWLSLDSALGTLLHVLAGYDPQPSGLQLTFYLATLAMILIGMRIAAPAKHSHAPPSL